MIEIDDKKLLMAINEIAATDAGRIFFAALKDSCKWDITVLSSDEPQVTQFFAAQRAIYGSIRRLIRIEHLKEIEFNFKFKRTNQHDRNTNRFTDADNNNYGGPTTRRGAK